MSERERFEAWMSDDGKWPRAIERDSKGEYLLAKAASDWTVWQAALARSGQAASGSSQGARSDDLKKPADAQDDDRAAFAWWCRKNGHGELDDMLTPLDRSLRALMWPVWQGAIAYMAAAKIGQPEAPTAAPLSLAAKNESLRYDFSRTPDFGDILDWMRKYAPEYLAHPPARSGADPTGRTPTDYALEHAEYLAQSAELFIASTMALQKAEIALEEAAEPTDYMGAAIEVARESLSDHLRWLESNVYEFRKRRDRAIARSGAGSEEGQG